MLLFALELSASACSMVWDPAAIVSPADGTVPPGFHIRAGWESYPRVPWMSNADGERIALVEVGDAVWQAAEALPPGEYNLDGSLIEVSDTVDVPAPQEPALLWIGDEVEWVSEAYNSMCRDYQFRRHLIRSLTVELPAAEGDGWAVQVTDESLGHLGWLAVGTEDTAQTITLDLGRVGQVSEEACVSVALVGPTGEEAWSNDYPCETISRVDGCSTAPSPASLSMALLALIGAGWRRRR